MMKTVGCLVCPGEGKEETCPPQSKPTHHMKVSNQDASADMKSKGSYDFRQLSDMLHYEESSEEEELYADSLTSHTTGSDSTKGNLSSLLGPISSTVEDCHAISKTESQFSSNRPYLEDRTPFEISPASTDDSVFVTEPNNTSNNASSSISSPAPPTAQEKHKTYNRETP